MFPVTTPRASATRTTGGRHLHSSMRWSEPRKKKQAVLSGAVCELAEHYFSATTTHKEASAGSDCLRPTRTP